jgi:glycosidase
MMKLRTGACAAALALAAPLAAAAPAPSADWRDQVLYFVLTDRFDDGDPRNNDQGRGEYRPGSPEHYQGGDFAGLQRRLDYIRGLGATGVWVTPPVANQWLDPSGHSAGYHGYWAEHFMRVDPHLGTLADYRALARGLHGRGMKLVQDIVVNHTGNFFGYRRGEWRADDPAAGYWPHPDSPPVARPSQWPFSLNDPRRPEDRRAGIYHWTPDVTDYTDRTQVLGWQMSALDDLNTENPVVRRALRQSYAHWVRKVGVDGFRVDTAFYVPPDFFTDFLHARDPKAPGIARVARAAGKPDFFSFGEGFGIDGPGQDAQTRLIESYAGPDRLGGMLNFPLYGALGAVFGAGRAPAELAERIQTMMRVHRDPWRLPSFVDNHDVDRFLAGGPERGLRQALLAVYTLPGIPVIYYGTEQGFTAQRAAMFAAGAGSGGRDHFNPDSPLYRLLGELAALRAGEGRLFSRGRPELLHAQAGGPGALVWRTHHQGRQALVAFNTADHELLVDAMATGLPPGTRLQGAFGLDGRPAEVRVDAQGRLTLRLPPHAGLVWHARPGPGAAPRPEPAPSIDPLPETPLRDQARLQGHAASAEPFWLVADGRLDRARRVAPGADGRWALDWPAGDWTDPDTPHRLVAWRERDGAVSAPRTLRLSREWVEAARHEDPAGDDHGRDGRYRYPADPSYADRHPADLRAVTVRHAGGALQIEVALADISRVWNPPMGLDHVALTAFIELPGQAGGAREMPGQQATLPGDLRWHRRLRLHGWSNALFSHEGASATNEGRPLRPAADVRVDAERRTLRLTLAAEALGGLDSLSGARVYLSTWDYDGGFRALAPQAQAWAFGGGPADGPKVMDETPVLTLR